MHSDCIDVMTFEDNYLTAELDGDNLNSLRLIKTSVRPMMKFKLRVHDSMPWPKVGAGSRQGGNATVEESKEPRSNQAAATSVDIAEDAGALIDEFGRMMGKDFSTIKNNLRDNDINEVSELANLSDDDLNSLGFTTGLKLKLKKFLSER